MKLLRLLRRKRYKNRLKKAIQRDREQVKGKTDDSTATQSRRTPLTHV